MVFSLTDKDKEGLNRALKGKGLRPTKQRTSVYEVILRKKIIQPQTKSCCGFVENCLPSRWQPFTTAWKLWLTADWSGR